MVTHAAQFRHGSIDVAERVRPDLGRTSRAFTITHARTAENVRQLPTPAVLRGMAAVAFVNTTGAIGVPDLQALADWIGHAVADVGSLSHGRPAARGRASGPATRLDAVARSRTRVYTALGHRDELWRDADFQRHVLGGVRWALGG